MSKVHVMGRILPSWLDGFVTYTQPISSTDRFRLWAGIGAISAVLNRKVWTVLRGTPLYANSYIILCGKAGAGKSQAIVQAKQMMVAGGAGVLPSSLTKEKLYLQFNDKYVRMVKIADDPIGLPLTAVVAASEELGVLLRAQDEDFMTVLTDWWDNPNVWTYDTKASGHIRIERLSFNILAGTTPQWLAEHLPVTAYDLGFAARLILVNDETPSARDNPLFTGTLDTDLQVALQHDMARIARLNGEFVFTQDAKDALIAWHSSGMEPKPREPRLESYNGRRVVHLVKLMMVLAAARGDKMEITKGDFEKAKAFLLDAESAMPKALEYTGKNEYMTSILKAEQYIYETQQRYKRAVPESLLKNFLIREVPVALVGKIIQAMLDTNRIVVAPTQIRSFEPAPKLLRDLMQDRLEEEPQEEVKLEILGKA